MSKDPPYDRRVGDQRDQPTPRATGRASEDVDLEDPAQQLRPGVAGGVVDFDLIEKGAASGAPKSMEWYGAFALLVTLIWLYIELLRLLSKMRSR